MYVDSVDNTIVATSLLMLTSAILSNPTHGCSVLPADQCTCRGVKIPEVQDSLRPSKEAPRRRVAACDCPPHPTPLQGASDGLRVQCSVL